MISLRYIIFYVLFLSCITHLSAQYTTSDFGSTSLISNGLIAPGRMAIDSNDHIYVTDAIKKGIVKFDAQGNYLSTIINDLIPLSIAINDKNQLFVGDQNTGDIYTIHSNGTKTKFYTGLSFPASMVFGSNNILYVVDSKQKKVIGLNVSGAVVKDFTNESFTYPTGIAFDKQNNHIIVSEHGGIGDNVQYCYSGNWQISSWGPNTSIYTFDIDGNMISSFGCFGNQDGRFQRIQGITVGTCGNIYAVDPYLGRVNVFDPDGNYITQFGQQGDNLGELNLPMDIVFSSDNRVFVSSMNKGEVDIFTINESLPTATITSNDKTICAGTSTEIIVNFTGTAPWTFTYTIDGLTPIEITTSDSTYSIIGLEEGLYEIASLFDATATGTCFTGSAYIQVSNSLPTATIVTTDYSKCNDDLNGIEIQFTGIAPWTFIYTIDGLNPREITTNISPYELIVEEPGLYEIIALSDAGCIGDNFTGKTNVTIYPLPTSNITNGNGRITLNPGEMADLNIVFTGTAPWTFIYAIDGLNPRSITTNVSPYILQTSEEGTYEVLETQDAYCHSNITDGFPDIVINDTPDPTKAVLETVTKYICKGETTDLIISFTGIAPWTFSYTIDGVNPTEITTSESSYQIFTAVPGVYEINSVSDALGNPGIFSGSTIIIENQLPAIELPDSLILCEGNSAELNPGNFESYLWDNGSVNQTLTIDSAGFYTVNVTDQNGCTNSATIEVIINPLPVLDLGPDIDICEGDSTYILDAGLFDNYLWNNGSTNRYLEVSATGTYSVTVTNAEGCSSSAFVNATVYSLVSADFFYDINRLEVQFISRSVNANAHYWEFGDGNSSIEENPLHTYRKKGTYTVTYMAISDFCGSEQKSETMKVGSNEDTDVIVIYPNPSYGEFTLKITPIYPITTDISILINSTAGQTIYSEVFNPNFVTSYNGSLYININIERFTKGVYIIYINAGNFTGQDKLILKD